VVIESTSGTFGLALAMECRLRGRPLVLVSDPAVDPALRRRMRDLGAAVDIVAEPAVEGGYQRARLDRLAELCSRHPRHFLPAQYSNPREPRRLRPARRRTRRHARVGRLPRRAGGIRRVDVRHDGRPA
jgi:S-sulfo-L-cysteine synthase (3-phospho-L-serine-dependent)